MFEGLFGKKEKEITLPNINEGLNKGLEGKLCEKILEAVLGKGFTVKGTYYVIDRISGSGSSPFSSDIYIGLQELMEPGTASEKKYVSVSDQLYYYRNKELNVEDLFFEPPYGGARTVIENIRTDELSQKTLKEVKQKITEILEGDESKEKY